MTTTYRSSTSIKRHALVLAAALLITPALAGAQGDMPDAKSLVEKHIAASGGRAALERAAESVTKGSFSVPAVGLAGTMTTTSAPNKAHIRVELAGLGTMLSGFDGTNAWSMDPMQGPRIMDGAERDAIVDGTKQGAAFRDSTVVRSMKTTGRDTVEGMECWLVDVVWSSGRESKDCYAVDSGRLHASLGTQEGPMGKISVTTVLSDYKEFDGVTIPTRITQKAAGQEIVTTIESLTIGNVPDDAFEPPPEVKTLIGRR